MFTSHLGLGYSLAFLSREHFLIAVFLMCNFCRKGVEMAEETKAIVTVSEMARMVGLSRARFYQLQKAGIFPPPDRDAETGRPFFCEALQKVCLEIRRRNCGANGKPILFYARRVALPPPTAKHRKAKVPKNDQHTEFIEALQALGLAGVTTIQVGAAMSEVYPKGAAGVEQTKVIRAVFLHLRRKN